MSAETPSSQPFSGLPGENRDGVNISMNVVDFDAVRSGAGMNVATGMNVGMNAGNRSDVCSDDLNQCLSINSILNLCKPNNPDTTGMSVEVMLQQISQAQSFLNEQQRTLLSALQPEQRQVYEQILSCSNTGNTTMETTRLVIDESYVSENNTTVKRRNTQLADRQINSDEGMETADETTDTFEKQQVKGRQKRGCDSTDSSGSSVDCSLEEGEYTEPRRRRRNRKQTRVVTPPFTSTPSRESGKGSSGVLVNQLPTVNTAHPNPQSQNASQSQSRVISPSQSVLSLSGEGTSQSRSAAQRSEKSQSEVRAPEQVHPDRNGSRPRVVDDRERTVYLRGKFDNMAKIMYTKWKAFESELTRRVGPVKLIRPAGPAIRVICNTTSQVSRLLEMKEFMGKEVDVSEPFVVTRLRQRREYLENRQSMERIKRYVIKGVPLDFTDDEVKEITGAQFARRLTNYNGVEVSKTGVIVIGLRENETISNFIDIGPLRLPVDDYIPRPLRCHNCNQYFHTAMQCKARKRCPRCNGEHAVTECTATVDQYTCRNCGGNHSAAYKECPRYQEIQETLVIQRRQGISYADAAKKVREYAEPTEEVSRVHQQGNRPTAGQRVIITAHPDQPGLGESSASAKSTTGTARPNHHHHHEHHHQTDTTGPAVIDLLEVLRFQFIFMYRLGRFTTLLADKLDIPGHHVDYMKTGLKRMEEFCQEKLLIDLVGRGGTRGQQGSAAGSANDSR